MQFIHYQVNAGPLNIIQVNIDRDAYVRLMDDLNFGRYRKGKPYSCEGGLTVNPFVQFRVTEKKLWHIVVDLNGQPGEVKASIDILSV